MQQVKSVNCVRLWQPAVRVRVRGIRACETLHVFGTTGRALEVAGTEYVKTDMQTSNQATGCRPVAGTCCCRVRTKPKIHYIWPCIGGYQNSTIHETFDFAPRVGQLRASRGRLFQVSSHQKARHFPATPLGNSPEWRQAIQDRQQHDKTFIGRDNTGPNLSTLSSHPRRQDTNTPV